jgi:hypothetical protein
LETFLLSKRKGVPHSNVGNYLSFLKKMPIDDGFKGSTPISKYQSSEGRITYSSSAPSTSQFTYLKSYKL